MDERGPQNRSTVKEWSGRLGSKKRRRESNTVTGGDGGADQTHKAQRKAVYSRDELSQDTAPEFETRRTGLDQGSRSS